MMMPGIVSPNKIISLLESGQISADKAFSLLRGHSSGFQDSKDGDKQENNVQQRKRKSLPRREPSTESSSSAASTNTDFLMPAGEAAGKLSELIGLQEVKSTVREIIAMATIQKYREKMGLTIENTVLHMIFKGNPGTGKTTVARILSHLFSDAGILEKGHMVEVERADIVGEYIGHTAQKTRKKVYEAEGGVLFVDEAYSLARGGEKDFGKEAIDTLVKAMEDRKDDFVLVLAGYQKEMEWFLRQNPGLQSRFPMHLDFPNYSCEELFKIGEIMLRDRQYKLSTEGQEQFRTILESASRQQKQSGNARLVRNLIERAMRKQALRLAGEGAVSKEDLMTLTSDDLKESNL